MIHSMDWGHALCCKPHWMASLPEAATGSVTHGLILQLWKPMRAEADWPSQRVPGVSDGVCAPSQAAWGQACPLKSLTLLPFKCFPAGNLADLHSQQDWLHLRIKETLAASACRAGLKGSHSPFVPKLPLTPTPSFPVWRGSLPLNFLSTLSVSLKKLTFSPLRHIYFWTDLILLLEFELLKQKLRV